MNTRTLSLLLLGLAAFASPLSAASQDRLGLGDTKAGEASASNTFWTCIVGDPSEAVTMVKLSTITSVSKQTYMLDNSIQMREVTIDTIGNNTIRFYCASSARANIMASRMSNARDLVDKYTEKATRYPGKKYPEGTHSHNVEYQVASPSTLDQIYDSVANAWQKNKGCTLRVD